MVKTLKNLLVRNRSSDFQKISQGWPLRAPLKKLFKEIWFVKKHGRRSSLNFACLFVFAYFVKTFKNLPHFLSDPFQICTVSLYQSGHKPYKKWALLVHEVQNYLPLNWENGVYAIKSKFFIQFFPNLFIYQIKENKIFFIMVFLSWKSIKDKCYQSLLN